MPDNQLTAHAALDFLKDADTRRKIIADPKQYARDTGMDVEGKEVMVTTCTRDVLYIPLSQPSEGGELSQDELGKVSAAGGTAGTASSIGTLCSSLSTAGSAGSMTEMSAGSAGCSGSAGTAAGGATPPPGATP